MKEINLPTTNTISFTLSAADQVAPGILMPDGLQHVSMGNIGPEDLKKLETARANGGKILWATVCLEKEIESVIVNYFMGPFSGYSERRELFQNELLKASFFQFSSKKHLIDQISLRTKSFKGKDRSKIQGYLKSIMQWRNAFAHGSLTLDSRRGVMLSYYSGGQKSIELDDNYWKTVEASFKNCSALVKQLRELVSNA